MDTPHSVAEPPVYALFRMVVGFLFVFHGLQKLFGLFGGPEMPACRWSPSRVSSSSLAVGLSRLDCSLRRRHRICCTEMAAAYLIEHLPKGGLPIQNKGEGSAMLFCFAFLFITGRGAGVWSGDAIRGLRWRLVERGAPYAYVLIRIGFGFLYFLRHGLQKVFGMFDGRIADLSSPRGVAGMIELVAGAIIAIGVYARPAAFVASGEMAVAYFLFQQPAGFWPIQNHGEPAVLYCFAFLYISARGAGLLSVDHALGAAKESLESPDSHSAAGARRLESPPR